MSDHVEVVEMTIAGTVLPVSLRVYRAPRPVCVGLVWVHGGGFASGDLDLPEADATARVLAARGVTVVSAHYRLATDGVVFPAPSDDVMSAWQWAVLDSGLPVDPGGWSIGGASAGACLAASVALQCVDGLGPVPSSVLLAYPAVHGIMPEPSIELTGALARSGARTITPQIHEEIVLNYVGREELVTHPYAFPGHGRLEGYPPTLIVNCELDGLRASGEEFGRQLLAVGVDVQVWCEAGAEHAHLNLPETAAARHTLDLFADWLLSRDPTLGV